MKPQHKLIALALAAALCLAASSQSQAAVPLSWEVKPGQAAPVAFDRFHGESLHLTAEFVGFSEPLFAPGEDVRLWYQTNGMGSAWWSVPASIESNRVSAVWSPELDPGAERVNLFFGAPSNAYCSAVLRLRGSPGMVPNVLPLPVQRLDYAAIEVANAPYYTKSEADAKIVELAPSPGNYAAVSNAAVYAAITNAMQDAAIESNRVSIASNRANIESNAAAISTLTDTTSTLSDTISTLGDTVDEAYSLASSASDSAWEAIGTAYAASSDAQDASEAASAAQAGADHALSLVNILQEVVDELAAPKRVAMFVIPVNEGMPFTYKGFELKCSTNNFASAASESVKLQFYSQSEIADTGSGPTSGSLGIDKMKLFACTSYWSSRDRRSYSPIGNTIDYGNDLYSVVALVDVSCLKRHPEDNGSWLSEDNEDLVWCYMRDTANDVEREVLTTGPLWRPIAPVKWFRELPSWAR